MHREFTGRRVRRVRCRGDEYAGRNRLFPGAQMRRWAGQIWRADGRAARRLGGAVRPGSLAAMLTVSLAAMLTAGCSAGPPAPYRPTASTCYTFAVRAIQQHRTVTAAPGACAGLSHEQVNQAAARAIRDLTTGHPKAAARRLARQDGAYLARMISAVPAPRPPAPAAQATAPVPAQPAVGLPLGLAALAAWVLTAAAGTYLLAGWLADRLTGRRPRRTWRRADRLTSWRLGRTWRPRPGGRAGKPGTGFIVGHFGLALGGLVLWIAFVVTGLTALAWIAVVLVVIIASLGMAILVAALPEPSQDTGAAGRRGLPVAVIASHGALATLTILLVVLAALR
jgi:manganese efflux pump family protein